MKTVRTRLLEIAYKERGPADGPPIILMHGFPDDATTWDVVTRALAREGFRTLAPYVRGYGATRFLDAKTMRSGETAALAQDIIDFADAMGIDRFLYVGHDWGGRTGYVLASVFPERLTAFVALATGYLSGAPKVDAAKRMAIAQTQAFWYQWFFNLERGVEALEADRDGFGRMLWRVWSPSWRFTRTAFEKTARSFANPDFVAVVISSYRERYGNAPGDPRYAGLVARLEKAPKISVPTTMLVGDEDGANLPQSSAGKEAHFTGPYKRRVLKGVGHFIQREAPDEVIKAVRAIAKATAKRPGAS